MEKQDKLKTGNQLNDAATVQDGALSVQRYGV